MVLEGLVGFPTLTIFMWQNGASFEAPLAQYISSPPPSGIDPNLPRQLQTFGAPNGSVDMLRSAGNMTLPVATS